MNKVIMMLFATGFLMACNTNNEKASNTGDEHATEVHNEHADEATGLMLNNGAKWKADAPTLANVAALQATVSTAGKESLEGYLQTAAQLQEGLNKMIQECKMQGEDHNALHKWLEPLMAQTKELQGATTKESADAIFSEIEKQVALFPQYFE